MNADDKRLNLISALNIDLVGPDTDHPLKDETLNQVAPSKWYLTGFIVPMGGQLSHSSSDDIEADDLDGTPEVNGVDDEPTPDRQAKKKNRLPSSIGISFLLSQAEKTIDVHVSWGDYEFVNPPKEPEKASDGSEAEVVVTSYYRGRWQWKRNQRLEKVQVTIPISEELAEMQVPNSGGLFLAVSSKSIPEEWATLGGIPKSTKAVSVFLVNKRNPVQDDFIKDSAFAFQAKLSIENKVGFVPRPNLKGLISSDPDERIADLQYQNVLEYCVGHGVATKAHLRTDNCQAIETEWIPTAEVEKVAPAELKEIDFTMQGLADATTPEEIIVKLKGIPDQYKKWIEEQKAQITTLKSARKETAEKLLEEDATWSARRIHEGLELLNQADVFEAFKLANKVMAITGKKRRSNGKEPEWRPFQLAFILQNLKSISQPDGDDRKVVDLLFFPTGGGKTEAYLGLSAFTLIMRRFRNQDISSAGVAIIMRYTLRLLTLDQLGRAAALICALELERKTNSKLGSWPFEIGLWVGQAATPNKMGDEAYDKKHPYISARSKVRYWKKNTSERACPIPLDTCPWCFTKFKPESLHLNNESAPTRLFILCVNPKCEFSSAQGSRLPILTVDEEIYKRLPCFLISTVDKFAALPWNKEVGQLFGKVQRYNSNVETGGFFGPAFLGEGKPLSTPELLPPDLIIQDELHLISGPMGTMAGLYEGAIDRLCERTEQGKIIKPKVIASTATVRRATRQIQALFNRKRVAIFPPPGPNIRDSFFAVTKPVTEVNARLYLGIGAQGRSSKVILMRVYLALLSASQKLYGTKGNNDPSVDPYMTLVGYFNSLRELGGARRVVEDEITSQLTNRSQKRRAGETSSLFADRKLREPLELTSRVSTADIADAKRRLELNIPNEESIDVALATNMISVGLDITRLGLMVVFGQPKTNSEYIQATSRVGRDENRPGIVVTIYNLHKHRDRSHYERFEYGHLTFYRNVEATSVTPFSQRCLDKGLAGTIVGLARHGHRPMVEPLGASHIREERESLNFVTETLSERVASLDFKPPEEKEIVKERLKRQIKDLFDAWWRINDYYSQNNSRLQYQREVSDAQNLLRDFFSTDLDESPIRRELEKFKVNRSMRDVEPSVNLWVKTLGGQSIDEEE